MNKGPKMTEKAKDFKGTFKRLVKSLAAYKFHMVVIFIFAIFSTIFSIVGPKILGNATTEIFNGLISKLSGGPGINFSNIALILIVLLSVIGMIIARYITKAALIAKADIAFFVFETENISQTLNLDSMVPRKETYNYNIAVSNEKDGIISQVPMEYIIKIKTTTNLPLTYKLYDYNGNELISNKKEVQDDDGVYYIEMSTSLIEIGLTKEIHSYKLTIEFPEDYKSKSEYADVIELVEIIVY